MSRSKTAEIRLTEQEEQVLRAWTRKGSGEQRLADRARIILMSHQGVAVVEIAKRLHTRLARVSKWRQRFVRDRLNALSDAPRTGKPRRYDRETDRRVLALLDQDPPRGYAQWNGRLLAEALGDVSAAHTWRILRKYKIQLQRRRSWCISTDPEFGPKAADVVGIYLNPPEHAVVLSVDEKPHIQALLQRAGELSRRCRCRTSPYLNNIIEQDHRFIKKRIAASLGFRSAEAAWRTIEGYEAMHIIRKGQVRWVAKGDAVGQREFIHTIFGIAA